MAPPFKAERETYSVSELNDILRSLIEDSLPSLWVQGELSNFARPASGHWYFTLKDARAQIRCAMFRNLNHYVRPIPKDGDAVLVRARAGVYPARGELQLIVEHLEPAGTGALLRAFEELKTRLAAEGLFDAALKRPIPKLPRRIGLITSATGAAVHDVLTTLARRWPLAPVLLHPVPVQGTEAPAAIVRALAELPRRAAGLGAALDLVLLVRGGGSLEDLCAFNDERVARAIRACAVPVVCGVGHEVDTTIADFAADLRAATPTAAAERVTPDAAELAARLGLLLEALRERFDRRLQVARTASRHAEDCLQKLHPARRLQEGAQRLDELDERLRHAMQARLGLYVERRAQLASRLQRASPLHRLGPAELRLSALSARARARVETLLNACSARLSRSEALLGSLNPQAVLDRGYAIVRDPLGHTVRDAAALTVGDALAVQLARGAIEAQVRAVKPALS
jgi:exodeoxyribonuclease VII large subunit